MVNAVGRDLGAALRLGEDERALEDRLGVERQTLGCPGHLEPAHSESLGDVCLERRGVGGDGRRAGLSYGRGRLVRLLQHGSYETGELS